jgi:hypothetical protein
MRSNAAFNFDLRRYIEVAAAAALLGAVMLARQVQSPPRTGDITLFPEQHNINRFAAAASLFGEAHVSIVICSTHRNDDTQPWLSFHSPTLGITWYHSLQYGRAWP